MNKIIVSLNLYLSQIARKKKIALKVPEDSTLQDVFVLLYEMLGISFQEAIIDRTGSIRDGILVVQDGQQIPKFLIAHTHVNDDSRISLTPMVFGG